MWRIAGIFFAGMPVTLSRGHRVWRHPRCELRAGRSHARRLKRFAINLKHWFMTERPQHWLVSSRLALSCHRLKAWRF